MGCIQIHIPWNPLLDVYYPGLRLREGGLISDPKQDTCVWAQWLLTGDIN